MCKNVEGYGGPLTVQQFKGGQSNPTYRLDTPGRSYVMRRKPFGKLLPSAHAVDREFRVISALGQQGFPVAHAYALCTDASVIGASFYLCVPKIRFCNIDGEGRQGQVVRRRRRDAQSRDGEGRPCSEIDGSSTHYNRRHIRVGSGEDALRKTRSCGRDIRGGSSR